MKKNPINFISTAVLISSFAISAVANAAPTHHLDKFTCGADQFCVEIQRGNTIPADQKLLLSTETYYTDGNSDISSSLRFLWVTPTYDLLTISDDAGIPLSTITKLNVTVSTINHQAPTNCSVNADQSTIAPGKSVVLTLNTDGKNFTCTQ